MADSIVRSRIDPSTKKKATSIFHKMGISMSDGIRMFLTQVVETQSIPFELKLPNKETVAALKAADEGKVHDSSLDSIKQLWDEAK